MGTVHDKLQRVRKPRVHIQYDVETEGSIASKELPFVIGVMGDFSGNPAQPLKPLKQRKFVQIDADNFDDVMARMAPGLNLSVENKLADDDSELSVKLQFNSLQDFEPEAIVQQVPALKKLLDMRNQLRDLLSQADRSEELEAALETILQDSDTLKKIAHELNLDPAVTKNKGESGNGNTVQR